MHARPPHTDAHAEARDTVFNTVAATAGQRSCMDMTQCSSTHQEDTFLDVRFCQVLELQHQQRPHDVRVAHALALPHEVRHKLHRAEHDGAVAAAAQQSCKRGARVCAHARVAARRRRHQRLQYVLDVVEVRHADEQLPQALDGHPAAADAVIQHPRIDHATPGTAWIHRSRQHRSQAGVLASFRRIDTSTQLQHPTATI